MTCEHYMKFQCRSKSKADWDTPTLIHLHFACGCIRTKTDLSSCKQTVWSVKPEKCTMWLFTEKKVCQSLGWSTLTLASRRLLKQDVVRGKLGLHRLGLCLLWAHSLINIRIWPETCFHRNVGMNCESRFRADNFP